jgi:hypothetical protein
MSGKIEGSFINFRLVKDTKGAIDDGVIIGDYIDTDQEQCHISELERELMAFDEEEVYVTTKTLIKYHRKVFTRILEYINKEGEKKNA